MKKKFNFIFGAFIYLFCLITLAFAQDLQVYSDKEKGFQISYPDNWIKKINSLNYNVLFHNKDENVYYGVLVVKNPGQLSAEQYLARKEKKRKIINIAEVKKVSKEELKIVGADDCSLGVYEIKEKNVPIVMKYKVFTKGKMVYLLIQSIKAGKTFEENGVVLDKMTGTFKINKSKNK